MCGIAEVLHNSGYRISGSDLNATDTTSHLESLGIGIEYFHDGKNVIDTDVVVTSSAVGDDNLEVIEAHRRKIPVIRRAEMLAELMRMKISVAVAGTHGKTTTTSLIGHLLKEGGLDPTVIVGGRVLGVGSNAYLGKGDYLVAEADEFDRSISKFYPIIAVITSLEPEHMECYRDYEDLEDNFAQFGNRVPFFGSAILCADDPGVRKIEPRITRPVITYGIDNNADFSARDIVYRPEFTSFVLFHKGRRVAAGRSPLHGKHNMRNLLAAIAVAHDLELPLEKVLPAAATFSGISRRLELVGASGGILIYDDYAHHPTEIKATLEGVRDIFDGRIVAVFQPHLYSRTQKFYDDFGQAFFDADLFVALDVYPSREKPVNGVTGQLIADSAEKHGHKKVTYIEDKNEIPEFLKRILKEGDRVIFFGAGDIYKYSRKTLELLNE